MPTDASRYHPRRMEKAMAGRADQLAVIRGQRFLTLAMCRDNEPYLVALNYAWSGAENCFYVHCAAEGRKLDILRANPRVWGQIVEDRGYLAGRCTHAYRTVMFEAVAEFVGAEADKHRALEMLIDAYEPDPAAALPLKARLLTATQLANTTVLRLRVHAMAGKQSPPPAKT